MDLPDGWATAPLELLVDILDSVRVPVNAKGRERRVADKPEDALFPYYGATGQVGQIDDYLFDEPLVLLGEDGVSFLDPVRPKAYLVDGKCWVNNHAHVLRALTDRTDRRYICAALNAFDYNGFVSGSTRLKLTQAAMRTIPIRLAPVREQRRIADKLDAVLARVDACCERLDRVPAVVKRIRQSVLAAATSGKLTEDWREGQGDGRAVEHPDVLGERGRWRFDELPAGWSWKRFTDVFVDKTDSRRKLKQKDYETSGQLAVVDQGEGLVGGFTSRMDLKSEAVLPVVVFGDHTRCVKYVDFPFVQGADGVKVLEPRGDFFAPRFAYLALLACDLPSKGYSRHMRFLRATWFPVPPVDEQIEIADRAESLLTRAELLESKCEAAVRVVQRLTPSLLRKAFRGELVRQDPGDEPAGVLLGRIRADRSAAEPKSRKRKSGRRSAASNMKESVMLKRSGIDDEHLSAILKERGPLTAEALWSASQLEIDDFYDQLKAEEERGLLLEKRGDSPTVTRMFEAAA